MSFAMPLPKTRMTGNVWNIIVHPQTESSATIDEVGTHFGKCVSRREQSKGPPAGGPWWLNEP